MKQTITIWKTEKWAGRQDAFLGERIKEEKNRKISGWLEPHSQPCLGWKGTRK